MGRSIDVKRRLRIIECSSGMKAKNVYTIEGGKEEERLAHSLLENRLEGEFFAYPFHSAKEILNKIASGEIPLPQKGKEADKRMAISMGEKIKIVLRRRNMTITELAKHLGTTRQNLTNKFARDNFSEKEVKEIARILNCEFVGILKMLDTGEEV